MVAATEINSGAFTCPISRREDARMEEITIGRPTKPIRNMYCTP